MTSQHGLGALTHLRRHIQSLFTLSLAEKCQNDQSQGNFIKVAWPRQLIKPSVLEEMQMTERWKQKGQRVPQDKEPWLPI